MSNNNAGVPYVPMPDARPTVPFARALRWACGAYVRSWPIWVLYSIPLIPVAVFGGRLRVMASLSGMWPIVLLHAVMVVSVGFMIAAACRATQQPHVSLADSLTAPRVGQVVGCLFSMAASMCLTVAVCVGLSYLIRGRSAGITWEDQFFFVSGGTFILFGLLGPIALMAPVMEAVRMDDESDAQSLSFVGRMAHGMDVGAIHPLSLLGMNIVFAVVAGVAWWWTGGIGVIPVVVLGFPLIVLVYAFIGHEYEGVFVWDEAMNVPGGKGVDDAVENNSH